MDEQDIRTAIAEELEQRKADKQYQLLQRQWLKSQFTVIPGKKRKTKVRKSEPL